MTTIPALRKLTQRRESSNLGYTGDPVSKRDSWRGRRKIVILLHLVSGIPTLENS